METVFKVLTGTAHEVEKELNELKRDYNPTIIGMGVTNESTTVIVECYPK